MCIRYFDTFASCLLKWSAVQHCGIDIAAVIMNRHTRNNYNSLLFLTCDLCGCGVSRCMCVCVSTTHVQLLENHFVVRAFEWRCYGLPECHARRLQCMGKCVYYTSFDSWCGSRCNDGNWFQRKSMLQRSSRAFCRFSCSHQNDEF